MTCCFFGHKDAPPSIYDTLEEAIEKIIAEDNVTEFLVGNQGQFDGMVLKALRRIKEKYPHVSYNIVLAYMPAEKEECNPYEFGETMLPEGIENVHPRYAISKRNDWMVNESDIVLCYIKHSWGGASKYVEKAKHKGRIIINLGI